MDENADKSDAVCENSEDKIEEKPFDFEKFCSYMKNSILGNSCVDEDILENSSGNKDIIENSSVNDDVLENSCVKKDLDSIKSDTVDDDNDDVDLENYLLAYEQLYQFFLLLGTAFQFVALDVKSKIKILKSYQDKEKKNENRRFDSTKHFATVKSMVDYEKKNQLLTNSKYVSGCRTLLRLHRGLDFVRKFLAEIYRLDNDSKLYTVAREVYNQTLAKYHSWVVRNTARVAMQFLPSRLELLQRISCHSEEKLCQILQIFPDAIKDMDSVYDIVENIYTVNNLHDLP